jgi:hypothetical protein
VRAIAVIALLLAAPASPAQPTFRESAIKAAYLHKFPGFVEWPAETFKTPSQPIVVGVAGAEPVFEELTQIARGRLVQGRAVEVRQVTPGNLPHDLNVLFIGRESVADATALMGEARADHVLVVTDTPAGIAIGAALNFIEQDGRVRFEASPSAAQKADLKLSSRLLGVASRVVEGTP